MAWVDQTSQSEGFNYSYKRTRGKKGQDNAGCGNAI